jgi:hypothetical protein
VAATATTAATNPRPDMRVRAVSRSISLSMGASRDH